MWLEIRQACSTQLLWLLDSRIKCSLYAVCVLLHYVVVLNSWCMRSNTSKCWAVRHTWEFLGVYITNKTSVCITDLDLCVACLCKLIGCKANEPWDLSDFHTWRDCFEWCNAGSHAVCVVLLYFSFLFLSISVPHTVCILSRLYGRVLRPWSIGGILFGLDMWTFV